MICPFHKNLVCQEIIRNCFECEFNIHQSTLDGQIHEKSNLFYCPYCLSVFPIDDFITFDKSGKPLKLKQCPVCKNCMLLRTLKLVKYMSPSEYALWVWRYPKKDFWAKHNESTRMVLFNNLVKIGVSEQFWDAYNRLKEEAKRRYDEFSMIGEE